MGMWMNNCITGYDGEHAYIYLVLEESYGRLTGPDELRWEEGNKSRWLSDVSTHV